MVQSRYTAQAQGGDGSSSTGRSSCADTRSYSDSSSIANVRGRADLRGLTQRLLAPTALTLVSVAILTLVLCTSAAALIAQGHTFLTRFDGSGEDALVAPAGVAVSEATGEVFVADRSPGHERVERFQPDGGGYEFLGSFAVKSPTEIAVDNSSSATDPSRGDVYVVGGEEEGVGPAEHDLLYKYSPNSGKVVFKKTIFHGEKEELSLEDINGVAVDADGGLWVYWGEEGTISAFSDEEVNRWQPAQTRELALLESVVCRAQPGFAVAPHAEAFYAAHERETPLEECAEEEKEEVKSLAVAKFNSAGQLITPALDGGAASGVGVDGLSGEALVDNVSSVAAFSSGGEFIQRFGAGQLSRASAVSVDDARGLVYVLEPKQGKVAVFASEGAGPPLIDSSYAQNLSPATERLSAQIDPRGTDTTYQFQYGTKDCASSPTSCSEAPATPADLGSGYGDRLTSVEITGLAPNTRYFYRVIARNSNGSAESPESSQTFFTTLPSAQDTLADHRVWEMVSPPEKHGATIEPISREGALIQAAVDGNSITWAASNPVTNEAQGSRRPEPVQVISRRDPSEGWASQDIATPHSKGEGYEPGEATEYRFFTPELDAAIVQPQVPKEPLENPPLSPEAREKTIYRRNDTNGQYTPLVTAVDDSANTPFGGKLDYAGSTADASHVVFSSEVPLLTDAGEQGLYEWAFDAPLTLVSVLPGPGRAPASEPALGDDGRNVRNAISSDGSRVFWTNGVGNEGPLYMRDTVKEETIQINAAQGAREAREEEIAERLDEVHFQAANNDGSRAFFTDTWPLTAESGLEPLATEEVAEEPPAGSRALGRPADLYEYDVETGKLLDLTPGRVGERPDVLGTLAGISEDGSYVYFVANGVLAPGAEPGDCPRTKPLVAHPQASCNLYVSEPQPGHPEQRQTRLVARLSYEDAPDWAGGNSPLPGDLGGLTSQVSANGRFLAFMSDRELTGYANADVNPQADGAHDEEVYLYDAETQRLVCASCNPNGERPHGVYDTEDAGEGLGLMVDRPETWRGHWLAGSIPGWTLFGLVNPVAQHQSRYLSNNGRLFFNGAGAPLAQVTAPTRQETVAGTTVSVGVENVYEYEPNGEGSCTGEPGCLSLISSGTSGRESAFLDASENGNDTFFLTAAQLVAQDSDNTLDIYDARVCGTSETQPCLPEKPPPPPPCSGEECRPSFVAQQNLAPPATAVFTGPANTSSQPGRSARSNPVHRPNTPTRAQRLASALRACAKIKRRRERAACQAAARKRCGKHAAKPRSSKQASTRRRGQR